MDDSDVESICSSVSETGSPEASSGAKVYIGSQLPYFVTEKVIRNHFLQYGFGDCVTSVKLVYKDGRFMGWGCVYLKTAEYAQDAISKVNGTNLLVHEKYEHVLVVQHYVHKTRSTCSHSPSAASKELTSRSYGGRQRQSSSSSFQDEQASFAGIPIPMGGQETGEARQNNFSQFQVQFSSTNMTKQEKVAGDYTVSMDGFDNKPLIDEITDFQASSRNKITLCIALHHQKLDKFQAQLKEVQIRAFLSGNLMGEQRTARKQQVTECKEQESEFMHYCDSLELELDHLKSSVSQHSEDTLSRMRKDFERECSRFLKALPIYAKRRVIVDAVKNNQVIILIGQTGSGKSTQIVQYLHNSGFSRNGIIACTQPRKVAAVSLAKHVSTEMSVRLGTTLGYKMGASGKYCPETKVLYMTDHTLLNECIADLIWHTYALHQN